MKIELKVGKDSNNLPTHDLYINGESEAYILDLSDCPEDAHIGRGLIDGNDIIKYIRIGYAAGANGEDIEVIRTEE